jgi:peroxiredoxin
MTALLLALALQGGYEAKLLKVGAEAPEFKGSQLDDKAVALADYKGKVVLLNFWFLA